MATRKQRKRKEKEQRHDYVWVDEEGNEVASESSAATESSAKPTTARGGRVPQPPSWRRSFKRGAVFAPIMLATVMLLSSDLAFSQQLMQALFIVSVFIPFSYFLDRVMYRSFLKRQAKPSSSGRRPGS